MSDVTVTDVENECLVNFIAISHTATFCKIDQIPFNMKTCSAIWRFITKNELYGFIILYKTIHIIHKNIETGIICQTEFHSTVNMEALMS